MRIAIVANAGHGVTFRRVPKRGQFVGKIAQTIRYRERLRSLARLFRTPPPVASAETVADGPHEPFGKIVENAPSLARTGLGRHLGNLRAQWDAMTLWREWIPRRTGRNSPVLAACRPR
jgi:hypothetical protein